MKYNIQQFRYPSAFLRVFLLSFLSIFAFSAHAYNIYLDSFNTNYGTAATRLNSCVLCHYDSNGGGTRTPYGEDFRNNNYDPATIGSLDSDGDGFTNDEEAAAGTLTVPGLSCDNLVNVLNAPADLANYVDPSNPGCIGPGQPPVAIANGYYVVISGEPHTFSSAGSYDPDGTIASYLWNFGGYGASTEANPVFTFNIGFQARVTISLTVTDNDGNTSTDTTFVNVLTEPNSVPSADAGPAVSAVANESVQFDGLGSSDPEGANLTYSWEFGDGNSGSGALPTHSYARCGYYTVTLTVTDNVGLYASATTSATVSSTGVNPPIADAGGDATGHYSGEVGVNVQFDGSASADPDCSITRYSWDFGDGTTGLGVNPVHSYALAGDYVVTLTVTDNDALSHSSTATVTVIDSGPLDGAALYDTNCAGCHGTGSASAKVGADVTRINNGITSVPAMNGLATTLSAAQIQAIADYLVSLSPPPPPPGGADGATLYANNCAGCHGAGSASTKIGADEARITNAISSVGSMNYLSGVLSTADIQAIADFLAISAPPSTPEGLYVTYCASCHGVDARGGGSRRSVRGASSRRISRAINYVRDMRFLNFLSYEDIQSIATYLDSLSGSNRRYSGNKRSQGHRRN